MQTLGSSISWRVRGVDPQPGLHWLAPHTNWLFSSLAVRVWCTLAALAAVFVAADFTRLLDQATLWQWLMRPSSGTSLFLIFVVTRAAHELGHALLLTRFGGRCPDIGVIFMLGAPCVYCDVSESWRLPTAWRRAAVAAGGMYVELVIASLAAWLWLATSDGPANTLALQTMIVCSISTVLINANPLMRFDGYYILSDCLDEPNLRSKSDQCWMFLAKRWLLGPSAGPLSQRPASGVRFWGLAAFGLAGVVYRASLSLTMAAVVVALYAAWHLVWIGRLIAGLLLISWWVMPAMKFVRSLVAGAGSRWQRLRLAVLAAWVILVVSLVPIPCREMSTGWVQPARMQGVYAPTTARLQRVAKRSGDNVAAGEIVFELAEDEPRLRAIELGHAAEKAQARLVSLERQRYYVQDVDLSALQTAARTARQQAEHAEQMVDRQVVRSPFAGRLVSLPAPKRTDIDGRPVEQQSQLWLEQSQVGRCVQAGAMLGAVCSQEQIAVLPLDDQQLHSVAAGRRVKLRIPALGDQIWTSRVAAVVRLEQLDSVSRLIAEANQLRDPAGAASGPQPAASSTSAGYAAIVELPQVGALASAEVRAAVTVESKTLGKQASDWLRANIRWLVQ